MFQRVINSKAKSITFAAIILFFSGISSRILALVRDRLLAGNFGAGSELDVYFAAFRIPDFVYGIFILGGVSTVFLPLFSEYFNKDSKKGWEFTNNVLNCFLVLLILTCLVFAVFAPVLIKIILPGFDLEEREMAVTLTRIMFLSPILLGVSSIFSGVLHYFNRFLVYSLAPIFYNLGIILGIVFLFPLFGMKGLAFGVIIGAFLVWFWYYQNKPIANYDQFTSIKEVQIKGVAFEVELAITPQERAKGLSGRKELCDHCGMLFVFDKQGYHSFWMKDTLIPLDIIWLDEDWQVVDYIAFAQPQATRSINDLPVYQPKKPAQFVLEVPGGTIKKINNFKIGSLAETILTQ